MDVLLGEGQTERQLGDVILAPEDPLGSDEEIRQQLTKLWQEASTPANRHPRREARRRGGGEVD